MKTALVLVAFASTALAQQIPVPGHNNIYNGFSRGFGFTAQVDFLITQLDLPTDAFQAGDTAGYGVRVNGTVVYQSAGNAGPVSPGLSIFTGDVVDIVGNWSPAATGNFTAHNSYGLSAPFASNIIGVPHTLDRIGLQWDVSDPGFATAAWLAPTTGSIGRVLVDCAPLSGTVATVNSQGAGCTSAYASAYENFAVGANDLAGSKISWLSTFPGQVGIVDSSGSGIVAIGSLGTASIVPLSDDSQAAVGTLGLTVGSNGWIAFGGGNSNAYVPNVGTMLGNPAETFYFWHDMNPTVAGGDVYYEESGTQALITYDQVANFAGTAGDNNIQVFVDTAAGQVEVRFDVVSASGNGWIVGYSPGGPSADPGSIDISAAGVILTQGTDILPLTLTGIGRPIAGPTPVSYDVITSNIEAGALIHVGIVGLTRPGTPLSALGFGSGDCFLNASLDIITGVVLLPVGDQTWTGINLPIAVPAINGFEFNCQAATLDAAIFSSAGRASNGLKCIVGDV